MSAVAERVRSGALTGARVASPGWRARAVTLQEAEAEWRALEREGIATPYQRFDWVKAYADSALAEGRQQLRVVRVGAPDGPALAFLPLAVSCSPVSLCVGFLGGKQANYHMGVYDRRFAAGLDAAGARLMLEQAASAIGGADCFGFIHQPKSWDGVQNPLALLATRASAEPAYYMPLGEDCEADLREALSGDARKKQRSKRARLAEIGTLRSFVATTPDEIAAALGAFHAQKAARFAQMGVSNPFADPGVRAFLASAASRDPITGEPAVRIAVMTLDGAVIASFIGAVHAGRWSGMATAFTDDERLTRFSPGELLLTDVVRLEHALGTRMIDLGVGEARYKASLCRQQDALVDTYLAISAKGRVMSALGHAMQGLKQRVKASPLAYRLAHRLYEAARSLRPRPSPAPQA